MGPLHHNDQPLVSIIIPCYNAEAFIAEAIESALAQTYPHCEVLVVNDGSQDASGSVIEGYQDRVRYFKTDHLGACHARNIGLKAASGKRVQWLDADDVLRPNCVLSKLRFSHDRNTIPICDVAAMPGGKLAASWNKPRYDFISSLAYGTPPTPAPLHYRSDLVAIGGFREDLPCAQELDLHLRLLAQCNGQFLTTGEVGVDIRTHNTNLSRRVGAGMHQTVISILDRMKEGNNLSEVHAVAIAHHRIRACQQLWRMGHKTEALSIYQRVLEELPEGVQSHYFDNIEGWLLKCLGMQRFESVRTITAPIAKKILGR
ncbi:MAG: glycosyltransferase family 2 protein [Halomonas sp.]|nr:glycosyltransferase family A protein [Halomonas sp.]TVP45514.1 MAG: glycosyltransferase family 2 protein [Halomonas sp.]